MDKYNEDPNFPCLFWNEYVDERLNKNYKLAYELKKFIDDNQDIQGMTGEQMQDDPSVCLEIESILGHGMTWRSWGAMMSAYMNEKEGLRKYNYMSFYM